MNSTASYPLSDPLIQEFRRGGKNFKVSGIEIKNLKQELPRSQRDPKGALKEFERSATRFETSEPTDNEMSQTG